MDVMKLTLDPAWRIAHASSKADGRARWTEINVYALPADVLEQQRSSRRFVAEVQACSSMQGERTKTRRVATGTLARALGWIDDSDLGAAAKVEAREWEIDTMPADVAAIAAAAERIGRRYASARCNESDFITARLEDIKLLLDHVDVTLPAGGES